MSPREIFHAALAIDDPARRSAYLDEACAGNHALREHVAGLLQLEGQLGSFLESPPIAETLAQAPAPEAPGTVIGPYKLLEQIGEGGMGTVWMAQQQEPVKRVVALKLIKAGMDSKQVIARFEAERQALALMDHPNIAKVLDGGTVGQTFLSAASPIGRQECLPHIGRPYFVMDLVKGVPITKYCDEHHLTPRQRLELFIPVCQAVQHAHQKGIIHRDLKPSNVLVALYDGKPVPKVIDFGVAKATGVQLTEATLVTGFGAIVGTLEYMSPEQAEINQLDIDTRSDIYSLGVLLYELLTGSPPFTRKELEKVGMLEMLRVIREQEPTKPSTKLSTAEGLPTLAANRGTEPAKLTKLVRGELDWIVMKALEKERNRRYETANGLARDLQRYLNDDPVEASPPSMLYRLGKLYRRHRKHLTTGYLLVLIAGLFLGMLWRKSEAQQAEAEKRDVETAVGIAVSHLVGDLKAQPDRGEQTSPLRRAEQEIKLRFVLDRIGERLGWELREQSKAAGYNLETIGLAYRSLGEDSAALRHLERAVFVNRNSLGDVHHSTTRTMTELAELYHDLGENPKAESLLREVLEINRRFDNYRPNSDANPLAGLDAEPLALLASTLLEQHQFAEAESAARECLTFYEKSRPKNWKRFQAQNLLGASLAGQQKYVEAEPLILGGLEGMMKRKAEIVSGAEKRLCEALQHLVQLYDDWGKKDQAARWRRKLEDHKEALKKSANPKDK